MKRFALYPFMQLTYPFPPHLTTARCLCMQDAAEKEETEARYALTTLPARGRSLYVTGFA